MKAVNPSAVADYILECDKDLKKEDQTIWKISQLTSEEQAFIKDLAGAPGTQIEAACHLGLAGADNFCDANGDMIIWKRDSSKRALVGKKFPWLNVLSTIPLTQRDELAARIMKGAILEDEERKNS